jgi:Tfp pilus assembly protein PilN
VKKIELDFVSHAGQVRPFQWVLLVLGLALLMAGIFYEKLLLLPGNIQLRQELAVATQKTAPSLPRMKTEELTMAVRNARQVSGQLNFPWSQILSIVGTAATKDEVALISIEPDSLVNHVVLIAEARDFDAMLRFLHTLQASHVFTDVTLQSHHINHAVPENPVRFRLMTQGKAIE